MSRKFKRFMVEKSAHFFAAKVGGKVFDVRHKKCKCNYFVTFGR